MHIDILLKLVLSSLTDLKTNIAKFEKEESPSTQDAEQLYTAIQESNKLLSAYSILKEEKHTSSDLDIHLKLMSVPTPEEKAIIIEPIIESISAPVHAEETQTATTQIEKQIQSPEPIKQVQPELQSIKQPIPLLININDKFRFINELFAGNASEYNLVLEQLNNISTLEDNNSYLKELKAIYKWNEDNEMVKKLYSITQKRFV